MPRGSGRIDGMKTRNDLPPTAMYRGDANRLRRMVHNILANGIKFTDRGGITVRVREAGDCLEIAVADTGCGIPADVLPDTERRVREITRRP